MSVVIKKLPAFFVKAKARIHLKCRQKFLIAKYVQGKEKLLLLTSPTRHAGHVRETGFLLITGCLVQYVKEEELFQKIGGKGLKV